MEQKKEYWVIHRHGALLALFTAFAVGLVWGMAFGIILLIAVT